VSSVGTTTFTGSLVTSTQTVTSRGSTTTGLRCAPGQYVCDVRTCDPAPSQSQTCYPMSKACPPAPSCDAGSGAPDAAPEASPSGGMSPTCPVAPGTQALTIYGAECYAGGPPTGACDGDASDCTICALPVLCSPSYGPRVFYTCSCSGGSWSCGISGLDNAACTPADASAADDGGDASLDAASDEDAMVDAPTESAADAGAPTDGG
jgi:hypothetical protein